MVSVCIILYNNEKFIDSFFNSLLNGVKKDWEIIFWDNNSEDKTVLILESLIKRDTHRRDIKLIQSKSNRGYAAGVNELVKTAKFEEIFLINPNSIVEKKCVENLLTFYQSHNAAIVAGRYIEYANNDSGTQPSAVRSSSFIACILQLTNLGKIFPFLSFVNNFWERETIKEKKVVGVSAGFTFFSKGLFNEVDGFDESFFMYLEDLDFCMRAGERGRPVYFYPQAQLQHSGGGSSLSQKNHYRREHWRNSRERFFKKHFSPVHYLFFKLINQIEQQLRLI